MTQENLDTQRSVVMNERRQRVENQPYGIAGERIHELLYPGDHPYHWPVIGYMEDIAAATLEDVRRFFQTYYAPNNAVLTVAGDFEVDDARRKVETWFGEIPPGPPVPPVEARLAPLGGERREVVEDHVRLPRVYLAFRAPAVGQRLWYAADLLAGILSGGKSSLLYRDLVYDRQIAQDVAASVSPYEEVATFLVVATARPGVPVEALESALLSHIDRLAADGPVPVDLERARNRALMDYFGALQKLETRADQLSMFTTYFDNPGGVAGEADVYRTLTGEDLFEYAAGWWREPERVALTFVPRGEA
jgi:zinc protease